MTSQLNCTSNAGKPDEGLRQYLVEEFVEDYQDGRLTRRDALKRIAGVLGSLVMAENLLAACAPPAQPAPTSQPTSPPTSTTAPTVQASPTPQQQLRVAPAESP
jgi:carboxymethylenebutenolidase